MSLNKIAAVCLAAGQGKRMQSSVQKQYLLIEDKPVLYYALKAFQDSPVDEVVLVVGAGEEEYCKKEIVDRYSELLSDGLLLLLANKLNNITVEQILWNFS